MAFGIMFRFDVSQFLLQKTQFLLQKTWLAFGVMLLYLVHAHRRILRLTIL